MKTLINNQNLERLIKGASVFTTGGGIAISDQLAALKKIDLNVEVWTLDEFDKNSFLCTVGEIGPTDVPPLKKDKIIKKMIALLEKETGKDIKGLFPPEIGQESVVLECANFLKLPIADFDPAGFRAVPYFDINIFKVKKIDFQLTPIVVINDKFEITIVKGKLTYKQVEKKLREMTVFSKSGLIFVTGLTVLVKKLIKNNINSPSYSKALKFGSIKTSKKLLKELKPKRIMDAKVVDKVKIERQGFIFEKIIIKDRNWNLYTLILLNEAIFLLDNEGKILESVPDRILLLEKDGTTGISGAFLKPNDSLTIAVVNPTDEWKDQKAFEIFGQERFKELLT